MSVEFEVKTFKRVGRKQEGEEAVTYTARQIKEGTIRTDSVENVYEDILVVADSDPKRIAEMFEAGANHVLRLEAGGYDEWQKAAKKLMASGLPFLKGKTLEQVVEWLKSQANS